MALTKEKIHHLSSLSSKFQTCVFDETTMEINSLMSHHGVNSYQKSMVEEEDGGSQSNDSAHSPPLCGSSNNGYVYKNTSYQLDEQKSLINFKANEFNNIMQGSESLLSFQQSWMVSNENNFLQGYNCNNNLDFSSCYGSIFNSSKEKQGGESSSGWLYSEPNVIVDSLKESTTQESLLKKRSYMGENMQGGNAKKPCTTTSKAAKQKSNPSKDPQSVAAKNRRERISERLKTLQELVPNGSKVDLVTMLEKAISYVKFLQLQVKVLAADEFWPVQGGKAPDIAQVREAIDAILAPQR